MAVYSRQITSALKSIEKKGQLINWKTLTDGAAVDPSEPWKPGPSISQNNAAYILFLPANRQSSELIRYLKGSNVVTGSATGLMPAVSFEPKAKDVVVRAGVEMVVKSIDPLSPNGEIILYFLEFEV